MFKKDPLQIIAFQTYGTATRIYLRGRALEDESINLEQKSFLKLLINAWKRFETDEIRHTELTINFAADNVLCVKTDNNGYFVLDQLVDDLGAYSNDEGWVHFTFSYKGDHLGRTIQSKNRFPGEMLIPHKDAAFGVVSDIDDTILHTGVTSLFKWRVIINTLLKTPAKRKALNGASEMYHRLHRGKTNKEANPIFYVSHSPWNLYRYLEYFLKTNNFPKGPIVLRGFPLPFVKKSKDEKPQKQQEIINLLETYPTLKFMLIGDSGERDAEIYFNIATQYPDRIIAIYLIDVKHKKKRKYIEELYSTYTTSPFLLVENDQQFIAHAKKHGFIT